MKASISSTHTRKFKVEGDKFEDVVDALFKGGCFEVKFVSLHLLYDIVKKRAN